MGCFGSKDSPHGTNTIYNNQTNSTQHNNDHNTSITNTTTNVAGKIIEKKKN